MSSYKELVRNAIVVELSLVFAMPSSVVAVVLAASKGPVSLEEDCINSI